MILIDGDVICYRAGFAAEKRLVEIDEEGYQVSRIEVAPLEHALQNLKEVIEFCLTELGQSEYKIYLTGKTNFRKEVATIKEYKANRKKARYPIHLNDLKEYLLDKHPTFVSDNEEADDMLGIALTQGGDDDIVVSNDKDLLMIPGKHFNFTNGDKKIIDEAEGRYRFWAQMLTGDSTDNIMGCPQIGPKKTQKALDGLVHDEDYWEVVYGLYKRQLKERPVEGIMINEQRVTYTPWNADEIVSVDLEDFLTEIGQLLWIRRQPNEMWQPPQGESE